MKEWKKYKNYKNYKKCINNNLKDSDSKLISNQYNKKNNNQNNKTKCQFRNKKNK